MSPAKQAAQAERLTDGWWALATTLLRRYGLRPMLDAADLSSPLKLLQRAIYRWCGSARLAQNRSTKTSPRVVVR